MSNNIYGVIEVKDLLSGKIDLYSVVNGDLVNDATGGLIQAGKSLDWYLHYLVMYWNVEILSVLWTCDTCSHETPNPFCLDCKGSGYTVENVPVFMKNSEHLQEELKAELGVPFTMGEK